jgi:hypothetical protein
MSELRIDAPDDLLEQLRRRAKAQGKSVEQVVIEDLRRGTAADVTCGAAPPGRTGATDEHLTALAEAKLGVDLARLVRHVSSERRQELAKRASVGRPLSEILIEERGE